MRGIVLFFFAILFYSYFPTIGIVFAGLVAGIFIGRWLDWDKSHPTTEELYAQDLAEGDRKFKQRLEERFPPTVDVYEEHKEYNTPTRLQEHVLANNPPTKMIERLKNAKKITIPEDDEKEAEEWMKEKT